MDFKPLILSKEFEELRKRQLLVIVKYINELLKAPDALELKGALEMARRIIKLPSVLINDAELTEELNKRVTEDMKGITTYLVRQYFNQ